MSQPLLGENYSNFTQLTGEQTMSESLTSWKILPHLISDIFAVRLSRCWGIKILVYEQLKKPCSHFILRCSISRTALSNNSFKERNYNSFSSTFGLQNLFYTVWQIRTEAFLSVCHMDIRLWCSEP